MTKEEIIDGLGKKHKDAYEGREHKELILCALTIPLLLTSAGSNIERLEYLEDYPVNGDETVRIHYMNGYHKDVNISMDSGIAMIRDVCKVIN